MRSLNVAEIYENPEFQSALVRLGIWGFAVIYVSAGALSNRYAVDINSFFYFFAVYLLFFISLFVSVLIRPEWEERQYISLAVDISANTVCIYMTGEASSPFFILYIWIFISYGTRYGKYFLNLASVMSVLAYSVVVTLLGQWEKYFFEGSFVLLALVVLPIYQNSLMRQLQNARNEAEKSNRMVGRFLSNMTNEMRSPLVDILATTKELYSPDLHPKQLDRIESIRSSTSMLDTVIGDVLDFYRLDAGQLHLQTVPFSMHAVVAEVCSSMVQLARQKQIELVCSISPGVPRIIVGDEQRLRQALTNIMRSSVNCCLGDELQICVRIDISNLEMLLFEIKGIASVQTDEELEVGDESLNSNSEPDAGPEFGSDLGKSFASRLIFLMGGEFGVGPRDDGVIYWFSYPAKTDDFEADQTCMLTSLQGKRVFIFEPNKTSRNEIVKCCEDQGMSVETVEKLSDLSNTAALLEKREQIDLVIIADSPAGRDIGRIADICHDVLDNDLPLLVLSYRRDCLDLGKYDVTVMIRKPFLHEELADAMEAALSSR
jgi:two-component system sensor histidine kinase RpfC